MNMIKRSASLLALAFGLMMSTACENIALVGRPSLEPDELVAEVERLDARNREIHLRPNTTGTRVINYNADTRVIYHGREYPVTHLEAGDIVATQLRQDSRGAPYADLIRVRDSIRDRGGMARPRTRIQMLDGTVEGVDEQRGSFEIREQSGERVIVSLPYDARRSDVVRLQRLRIGDRVRVEGRFLSQERFELEAFL